VARGENSDNVITPGFQDSIFKDSLGITVLPDWFISPEQANSHQAALGE